MSIAIKQFGWSALGVTLPIETIRRTSQTNGTGGATLVSAEQDHRRMLDLLGIGSLRPGRHWNPAEPNGANYDEAKANPYPDLPDPLTCDDGRPVSTAADWTRRRPEIVEHFDREIYGRVPKVVPNVFWSVKEVIEEKNGEFDVITKKVIGRVDNRAYPSIEVAIELHLSTPADAKGPVPVMMELGFRPNGPIPPIFVMPEEPGPNWRQQCLARGWGWAKLVAGTIQADNAPGLYAGIIGLCNHGSPRKVDEWGVLRAWAWGASRALDYLETEPAVDARKVGITGHSRYGKASLLAVACDARLAIGYICSSGQGGAKLHRRDFGEIIENTASSALYYWFAGNFLKYAGPLGWNDLPVDSHQLIALCAPRPVFIGAGVVDGDGWCDPHGMFMAEVAAGPVYRLLGAKDLGTTEFPPTGTALVDGDLAFRQHHGGHTPLPNWPAFITFASRYLKAG